ncbi:MAG: ABC transporter ATP-binding protein [Anaerolineales bacterium]|nr:ABC transporter ATP-binding protein [Anaerolineales bacterium]
MSETIISIENLSKTYQLGAIGTGTFYGDIQRWWAKRRGAPDPYLKIGETSHRNRDSETIWALRDININVQRGEAIGVIGRNGAGKSTLLKILSRVTAPTSGIVKAKGRIASLLEVGTGFHPELTGRENIYLNGAIMGMSRGDIQRKFDEIVDFSGVEKFIDTPVKRYSSGMYVRLAFAVAAHLEPEILLIDEVLAVGDAAFQKKCLGKMDDVTHSGRTIIFVSHQMAFIENLCSQALWLDAGQMVSFGNTSEIVNRYLQEVHEKPAMANLGSRTDRQGDGSVRFQKVWLEDEQNSVVDFFRVGDRFVSVNVLMTPRSVDSVDGNAVFVINDVNGYRLITLRSEDKNILVSVKGASILTFKLDRVHLMPGVYYCNLYFGRWGGNEAYDFVENALVLRVEPGDFYEIGRVLPPQPERFIVQFDIACRSAASDLSKLWSATNE